MIDDAVSPEYESPADCAAPEKSDENEPRASLIRTRVIPSIAALLMVGIVALILWSMFAPESARQQTNRRVAGAVVPVDPQPVADFQLEPLDGGEPVALSDFRGKIVIINFWASWCQPCIKEIPILMQAVREFDDDVVLLGLNTLDDVDEAIELMNEFGINYPVLNDNGSRTGAVAVEFGLVGVPETYVVNADGELIAYRRGEFESTADIHTLVALAR